MAKQGKSLNKMEKIYSKRLKELEKMNSKVDELKADLKETKEKLQGCKDELAKTGITEKDKKKIEKEKGKVEKKIESIKNKLEGYENSVEETKKEIDEVILQTQQNPEVKKMMDEALAKEYEGQLNKALKDKKDLEKQKQIDNKRTEILKKFKGIDISKLNQISKNKEELNKLKKDTPEYENLDKKLKSEGKEILDILNKDGKAYTLEDLLDVLNIIKIARRSTC